MNGASMSMHLQCRPHSKERLDAGSQFAVAPGVKRSQQSGFTLIEALATIAMLAILMAFAAPNLNGLLEAQRVRSATFDFIADVMLARNEALKRGAGVTVAPAEGGWSQGWTVTLDSDDSVLRARQQTGGALTFSGAPASLAFDRSGRLSGSTGIQHIELNSAALTASHQPRCISVDMLGRVRADSGACS